MDTETLITMWRDKTGVHISGCSTLQSPDQRLWEVATLLLLQGIPVRDAKHHIWRIFICISYDNIFCCPDIVTDWLTFEKTISKTKTSTYKSKVKPIAKIWHGLWLGVKLLTFQTKWQPPCCLFVLLDYSSSKKLSRFSYIVPRTGWQVDRVPTWLWEWVGKPDW